MAIKIRIFVEPLPLNSNFKVDLNLLKLSWLWSCNGQF